MPTSDQYTNRPEGSRDRVGLARWFVRPNSIRGATKLVSAPTWLGTVNVVLWLVGFLAVGGIGRALTQWSGSLWIVIALVVMIPIGWRWPYGQQAKQH